MAYPRCVRTLLYADNIAWTPFYTDREIKFSCFHQMEAAPIVIILGAPILASMGFKFAFVENILVRLLMVGAVIYAIQKDTLLGLLTLLAVVTLLIERNQAIITSLPGGSNAKISQQRNLYPMKAPTDIFTPIKDTEVYDDNEVHNASVSLEDSIPDLKEGPTNHDAPLFYKSLGVL